MTVLVDPEIRISQYVESILFYLNTDAIKSIIVCDNSNFDYSTVPAIAELALAKKKSVEFLYFTGASEMILKLGKGFGEGEIMNHVLQKSQLLQGYDYFYKVTGRIKVKNLDSVIGHVSTGVNHFQKIRINPFLNVKLIDTRFYRCSKDLFSNYLIDAYLSVNDPAGFYLEHAYTTVLRTNRLAFRNFMILPRFEGVSGSHGGSLAQSDIQYKLKSILNLVVEKGNRFISKI